MKRFLAALVFMIIASISFTGNVIAVAISADSGGQTQIGYSLLIISGVCIAVVVYIVLWLERDYQDRRKEVTGTEIHNGTKGTYR